MLDSSCWLKTWCLSYSTPSLYNMTTTKIFLYLAAAMVGCWFLGAGMVVGDGCFCCFDLYHPDPDSQTRSYFRWRFRLGYATRGATLMRPNTVTDIWSCAQNHGAIRMGTPSFQGQSQSRDVPAQVEFHGGNTTSVVFRELRYSINQIM
jgi:hypothetical protein